MATMIAEQSAAQTQVLLLSVIFFCCPGIFTAISSIAGGLQDVALAFRGNAIIYGWFTIASFAAAALVPSLGLRRSLSIGSLGYLLYAMSLWNLSHSAVPTTWSLVAYYGACSAIGCSAGFLWTAQGRMIMAYATEANQGRYLSTFMVIFSLGTAGGGLLTCILNWRTSATDHLGASNATFVAYVGITAVGMLLALTCIVPSSRVIKEDGEAVHLSQSTVAPHWREDGKALLVYLMTSREILFLVPLFIYSNWFYTYNAFFNVSVFSTRTSGLASACGSLAQMLAAHYVGQYVDRHSTGGPLARRSLAKTMLLSVAVLWNAIWSLGWYAQAIALQPAYDHSLGLDIVHSPGRAIGPLLLYVGINASDTISHVWIYWYMGSVRPGGRDLRTAGFNMGIFKASHSIGATIAWYIGSQRVAPTTQLSTIWVLANVALCGAFCSLRVKTASGEEASSVLTGKHKGYQTVEHQPASTC